LKNGYGGNILRVDLDKGQFHHSSLDPKLVAAFIGGRGINSWLLYEEGGSAESPFDPENPLIFGIGPLTGTMLPAASRFTVTARCPLTYGHGDANAGGFFGPELKFAGYDHIVFKGKAERPVYLWISDEAVELKDASHLWGKDTWETQELIREELGDEDIQIACIGPAGENLVRVACIIHGLKRAAAKGMGPIMGSKNLKAIAVRGTKGVSVADDEEFMSICTEILNTYQRKDLTLYGTPISLMHELKSGNCWATKNLQTTKFDGLKNITPDKFNEKYLHRLKACFGCSISCGRTYLVKDGEFQGVHGEGPELAAFWSWGTQPQVDNLAAILKSDALSNQMGVDCIETGDTIAFAMECYQRGLLSKEETGGLDLTWGNYEAVHALIEQIARREGPGKILGEGMRIAAQKIGKGSEYYARQIKGHSMPAEMRVKHGSVLGYLTSTRGADHLRGIAVDDLMPVKYIEDHFGEEALRGDGVKGKGKATKWVQDMTTIPDLFGVCKIFYVLSAAYTTFTPDDFARIYRAATGMEMSGEELLRTSERVYNVEQSFNVKVGNFSRKDDVLPERLFKEKVDGGRRKGSTLDRDKIEALLDEYYEARGWDKKTTAPTRKTLETLDLKVVADDLENAQRVPGK
jgi:aldehyde:ferredoxin oxidoreductase